MSAYLKFWGLNKSVFKHQDTENDFFLTKQTDELCKRIVYFCETGAPAILISGQQGSGKTTLAQFIQTQLPMESFEIVSIKLFQTTITPSWLWTVLSQFFGKPLVGVSAEQITNFLLSCLDEINEEKRRLIIIVDDAQMLASKESFQDITLLLSLYERVRQKFTLLLLTDPNLNDCLSDPVFQKNVTLQSNLAPWTNGQVKSFVKARLERANLSENLFSDDIISSIEQASRGIPGIFAAIAEHCLMEAYVNGHKSISATIAQQAAKYVVKGPLTEFSAPKPQPTTIAAQPKVVPFSDLMRSKKPAV